MNYRRELLVVAACSAVVAASGLAGCGGDSAARAKVHGKVVFDGKPVEKGTITFVPADGKGQTTGGEIQQGEFSVLVSPGPQKIEVRSSKVVGKRKLYDTPDSPTADVTEEMIPAAYNSGSTLTKTVEMPETRIDLELTPVPSGRKP